MLPYDRVQRIPRMMLPFSGWLDKHRIAYRKEA
jgi:hypothetical protein